MKKLIKDRRCDACGKAAERRIVVRKRSGNGKRTAVACIVCYNRAVRGYDFWATEGLRKEARETLAKDVRRLSREGLSIREAAKVVGVHYETARRILSA